MSFSKTYPQIEYATFLEKVATLEGFTSSNGKRYKVVECNSEILKFTRLDSKKPNMVWDMRLAKVYEAYQQLEDFSTANFNSFVPRM